MVSLHDILWGVVGPLVWAAIVLIVAWRGWRRRTPAQGAWGPPVAIGGGYAIGHAGISEGIPKIPPSNLYDWLFYVAVGLAVLGVVVSPMQRKGWVRAAVRFGAVAIAAGVSQWLLLKSLVPHTIASEVFAQSVAGWAMIAVVWWMVVSPLAERLGGAAVGLVLMIVAGAAAIVMMDAGSQVLGQFAGALAMGMLAAAVMGGWKQAGRIGSAGIMAFGVLMVGLMSCSHYLGDPVGITAAQVACILGAAVVLWAGELPGIRSWRGWKITLLRVAVAAATVGIVAVPAAIRLGKLARSEMTGEAEM